MLPRLDTFKSALFTRRIIAFNESFVPLGNSKHCQSYAVLWHEAVAGRKKEDLVSAFYSFLLHIRDAKKVALWLDNCAGQNKKWSLFCFLIYIVNSTEISTDEIELEYFEPGLTFMSADNFHHQVEKSLKMKGKVFDFDDFVSCVENVKNVKVHAMSIEDFSDWKDCSSLYKINHTTPHPYLSDMITVRAVLGKRSLTYKTSFSGPESDLNFITARAMKAGIEKPEKRQIERGIPQEKKDGILLKLGKFMPASRFWRNIKTSNVPFIRINLILVTVFSSGHNCFMN